MPPLMPHHLVFYRRVTERQVMVNILMVQHLPKCMENPNLYTLVDDLVVLHHPVQIMQVVPQLLLDLVYHQVHQWVHYLLKSQPWIPMLRYCWLDLVCFCCIVDIRKHGRVNSYIIIKRYIRSKKATTTTISQQSQLACQNWNCILWWAHVWDYSEIVVVVALLI